MLLEHRGKRPRVDDSAYVAPNATICGDVTIGTESRVLFGAVITAEGGPVEIGTRCILMENAVIRGTRKHPTNIGNHVLVGPRASLSGCTIEDEAFLATGATIFNGSRVGARSEVRVNGVVQVKTFLPPGSTVPIGWIAVGDPAQIFPPKDHDAIGAIQQELDFTQTVFGLNRTATMSEIAGLYTRGLAAHLGDRVVS
jgi:carbonic anhydrase/acetyltransferase-like protein (isoleucine patch superfamily)